MKVKVISDKKKIEKNTTTCHICHRPYDIANKPKIKSQEQSTKSIIKFENSTQPHSLPARNVFS